MSDFEFRFSAKMPAPKPGEQQAQAQACALVSRFNRIAKQYVENPGDDSGARALRECLDELRSTSSSLSGVPRLETAAFLGYVRDVIACEPRCEGGRGARIAAVAVLGCVVEGRSSDGGRLDALARDYRFVPSLTKLLIQNTGEPQLSYLIEVLTRGIRITWEEPHLADLLKYLCSQIIQTSDGPSETISIVSLSTLINLCYKNEIVVKLLTNLVNLSNLIKYLVSKKDSEIATLQICRFLIIVQSFKGTIEASDIHGYLGIAFHSLACAIKDLKESDLRIIDCMFSDLCDDPLTRPHVTSYSHYGKALVDSLKLSPGLLSISNVNKECLKYVLNILLNILKLELFSLRTCHNIIADLCIKACAIPELLGPALCVLRVIILQYEEEGMLPDDLMPVISLGFHTLLDVSSVDAANGGIEWLRFVSSLCDCPTTREAVLININIDKFDEIFRQTLNHYANKNFSAKNHQDQEIMFETCHICLSLAGKSKLWEAMLHKILSINQITKIFNACVGNVQPSQRKKFIRIIRHPNFPDNRLNELISEGVNDVSSFEMPNNDVHINANRGNKPDYVLTNSQENAITDLINQMSNACSNNNKMGCSTVNLMELFRYKIGNLERRLASSSASLESANATITSLNHSIVILDATNKSQEDILYNTQLYIKRLEDNCERFSRQIADAEKTIKKFQSKLAAERMDNENRFANIHHEYSSQLKELEGRIEAAQRQCESLVEERQSLMKSNDDLGEKLNEQTQKNGELASVLIKFEEKVKHKDKKLDELMSLHTSAKNELEQSQLNVKALEKTLLERDQRLAQTTKQLEELQRIQEIVANLMGNKSSNVSTNSG